MEAYGHNPLQQHTRTSHLSKLYSDVKKSADSNFSARSPASEQYSGLHLKYRIQTNRLVTWGLAWSEEGKGTHVDIDDSVARAGLTETVDSVLRNIKDVTEEAERIKSGTTIGTDGNSKIALVVQPAAFDAVRYEDLLRDLTASIDTLYDLSQSRRALARGDHPSFPTPQSFSEKPSSAQRVSTSKASSIFSSGSTLVDPLFQKPALSPYAGLPPRIDTTALRLPYEGPPPYESLGVPSSTRLIGQLVRAKVGEIVQNSLASTAAEVPVLIDYANFDSIYRDTHVPPPLQRLEVLAAYFQPMRTESQTNLSLIGYFEDPTQPRIGLVYDIPYSLQNRLQGNVQTGVSAFSNVSLLKLVQKSNKTPAPANSDVASPALEYRYRLALRLTEQLAELHSRDMYHGNINSNSVLFTMTTSAAPVQSRPDVIRSPLWASFDLFSKCTVEGLSQHSNLNIYRHPGESLHNVERTLHADIRFDLYSLALILLEIGLWVPIGDLYKAKYSLADFKLRLEKLYIPKLAAKCSTAYMRVVEACIRFADDASGTGMTTSGVYGLLLEKLRMCALLDEDDLSVDPVHSDAGSSIPPNRTALSRHQSDMTGMSRTKPTASPPYSQPQRFGSLSSIAGHPESLSHASTSPLPLRGVSRQPSTRSQWSRSASFSEVKNQGPQQFSRPPSFKEYKQRVILIQKKWREYRARCLDEIWERNRQMAEAQADQEPAWEVEERFPSSTTKSKRREFPAVQLPQALMDEWHNKIARQLGTIVERALHGSLESSSISLTAYGETVETARPTLLICCKSTAKVKHMLKRHFKYDAAVFDVRVKKDEVRRCHKPRSSRDDAKIRRSMAPFGAMEKAKNPDYQERPLCGASIGAYRDEEHLPPVSFGGIVIVDDMPYGMSVHHMLEADDSDTEPDPELDADADDEEDDDSSIEDDDDVSVFSQSDDEETVRPPSTMPDVEIFGHDGDMPGVMPDDFEEITITQPSLDDAIDLDLHVDEEDDEDDEDSGIDEDHLLSYKVGQIHASSGLRRTAQKTQEGFKSISQSLSQEIDWALFELVPPRMYPFNIVKGGRKYCTYTSSTRGTDTYPIAIRKSTELACTRVHCLGRTSGLGTGVIGSTMDLVKIHGRSTFSASWTVDGNFGIGGDSGAWVISNEDGRVCGHVLAARKGRTYICPMDLLLDDIKQTLGANRVELPIPVGEDLTTSPMKTPEMERSFVEEAVAKMRLSSSSNMRDDTEDHRPASRGGGVSLPSPSSPSPARRSMYHGLESQRRVEPVGMVG